MIPVRRCALIWLLGVCVGPLWADEAEAPPEAAEIAAMLEREPLSEATWPQWRARALKWRYDRTDRCHDFFEALEAFVGQSLQSGQLPEWLRQDAYAWYLLAGYRHETSAEASWQKRSVQVEEALREAVRLDPQFGAPYGRLAQLLVQRAEQLGGAQSPLGGEALDQAVRALHDFETLDPRARAGGIKAYIAQLNGDAETARKLYLAEIEECPQSRWPLIDYASFLMQQAKGGELLGDEISAVVARRPDVPELRLLLGVAEMEACHTEQARAAVAEARRLGGDPAKLFGRVGAARLESILSMASPELDAALKAIDERQLAAAEQAFVKLVARHPENLACAQMYAKSVAAQDQHAGGWSPVTSQLVRKFPVDGELRVWHAVALARDGQPAASRRELQAAREAGAPPEDYLGRELVQQLESVPPRRWEWRALAIIGGVYATYAGVMLLMVVVGTSLSRCTEASALGASAAISQLPHVDLKDLFSRSESWLGRSYLLALTGGLFLFYLSIPLLVLTVLGITFGLIAVFFWIGRIPVKLVLIIVVIGCAMAWALLKALWPRAASGNYGRRKTAAECPRLHACLADVAERLETEPIHDVYLVPGAEIGVHQEGRGPYGLFGVKRRVLTLGLCSLQCLSVAELQAILAHEYAHFSHRDTAYSRFVYDVYRAIGDAIRGLAQAGGQVNYVNPVFWFLVLYYRAYSVLASGFSRSREYLADRAAALLYGRTTFLTALTKVSADAELIQADLNQRFHACVTGGAEALTHFVAEGALAEPAHAQSRDQRLAELRQQPASAWDSHPTFRQRAEAVYPLPDQPVGDSRPAMALFEDPQAIERELLADLNQLIGMYRQIQAQAAPAEG